MQVMRVYENSTCMQRAAQACRYGGPMNPSSPSEPEGVPPPFGVLSVFSAVGNHDVDLRWEPFCA